MNNGVPEKLVTPAQPAKPAPAPKPAAAAPAVVAAPAPPPAPVPNPLPHLPLPFQGVDFALKGYHADATVAPDQVVTAAQVLDKEGFAIDTITGVDWLAEKQMEVVYDYFHPTKPLRAVIRCRIPRDNPELPTISAIFPGANWHERETHDFFGIRFLGHPNLTPFLLPEDATYHPLKKDFQS
ncbi:MAG TPA: NADH-quinone oxidoreductase subunit C [Candidatus Sulfotelmatobacter sp.]|nr:NADH-quinone oxidoreductase subunit C [Candidatus Sulfotelmatobacter sp.]